LPRSLYPRLPTYRQEGWYPKMVGRKRAWEYPTSLFSLSVVAAVRASLRALREGNGGGACGRETTIAGVLSSFDLRAHMKIGC